MGNPKTSDLNKSRTQKNSCRPMCCAGSLHLSSLAGYHIAFSISHKCHFKSQQGQKQFILSPVLNFYVTRCCEEQKQYKHVDKHLRGASGSDKHRLHRCFDSDLEVSTESLKLNLFSFYFAVFPELAALVFALVFNTGSCCCAAQCRLRLVIPTSVSQMLALLQKSPLKYRSTF